MGRRGYERGNIRIILPSPCLLDGKSAQMFAKIGGEQVPSVGALPFLVPTGHRAALLQRHRQRKVKAAKMISLKPVYIFGSDMCHHCVTF